MNTNEAKRIRIEEYLHSLGYNPVRRQGGNLWYKSPFRDEQEPSFKVNMERNLWYDFGAGRGGNIIALARELYASDSRWRRCRFLPPPYYPICGRGG